MLRDLVRRATLCSFAVLLVPTTSFALQVVRPPTLTMNPNGVTPLAGQIDVTADVPVRVTIAVSDGVETWGVAFPALQTQQTVPLLGLRPSDTYSVEVALTDAAGARVVHSPKLSATTGALPADFPRIAVYYRDPAHMEPGFTLLDKFRRVGTAGNLYSIIVDNNGEVRWYSTAGGQDGMRQLPNGRLLLLDSSEMDLLGNRFVPRTLQAPGLLHHDLYPTSYGNYLSLVLEKKLIPDFPTSETDANAPRQSVEINTDAVVEFRPDGSVQNLWHLADLIDPHRIGYDSTKLGFPLFDTVDWSHSNAVIYDGRDNSIIVSIRHQDAIIKFSRATGKLKWILGTHANWGPEFQQYLLTPVGSPFEWQYHQHAMELTPQGTLLLFDNGNYRASPFDGQVPLSDAQTYSRAVEYAIDETTMQIRQVWEYGAAAPLRQYSASQGDADPMPRTGNVLITASDTRFIGGVGAPAWGLGLAHTSIVEVTRETPARPVFDMRVYTADPNSSLWVYRTERIPSMYGSETQMYSDTDKDGIPDNFDNCTLLVNTDQRDTDHDGFGNICDPDLNNDRKVDVGDWQVMAIVFATADANADLDGDGIVFWSDLQRMIDMVTSGPGPSGVAPPR